MQVNDATITLGCYTTGRHEARGAASAPAEARRPDLEQLDELEAKLEEEHVCL